MRVLLVYRAPEFSPNNVSRDAAILNEVADGLRHMPGIQVDSCSETALPAGLQNYDVILHMSRRLSTLVRLEQLSQVRVINAPYGVRNVATSRELTLMLLQSVGIAVPEWWAFDPEEDEMFQCEPYLQYLLPGWVKCMRPDGARPDDVMLVTTPLQADRCILDLASQQVPDIVVTRHLEGDLIKCYYVHASTPFLYWFYPQEQGYSKFGEAEQHNTPLQYHAVAQEQLLKLGADLAEALGLQVFGFDAIVQPAANPGQPSQIFVIDVNDWPTFGPCHHEAAKAIMSLIFIH